MRDLRTIIAAIALGLIAGCGGDRCEAVLCGPCESALTLEIHDGQNRPVPGLIVEGAEMSCGEAANATVCLTTGSARAGRYVVTLRAPGFHEYVLETNVPAVTTDGCCSCGYEPITLRINLTPAT